MTALTARGGFRYPEPADNSRNVRTDVKNLADDVAGKAALYVESTAVTRPAPGTPGRLHRATDTGVVTWDTGTGWDDVAVSRAGGSTITSSGAAVKGLVVKGATGQTASLLEVQDGAGAAKTVVAASGALKVGNPATPGALAVDNSGFNAAAVGLVVRGAASQTTNLAEFQNDAGTVLARVAASGAIIGTTTIGTSGGVYSGNAQNAIGGQVGVGAFALSASGQGLVVRGVAGQTANLAEFQNAAGGLLFAVEASGRLHIANGGLTSPGGALGTYQGYFVVNIAGTERRIPYYS